MPKSTSQIRIGANGTIYVAPLATVAPTDVATAWGASWVDLGYASEDGVTFRDSKTTDSVSLWQMFNPARVFVTGAETSASFTLRQWSKDTVKLAFGGGTITTTAGPPAHYLYTPPDPSVIDERAMGIEWVDGSVTYRLVMPRVMVAEGVETNLTRTGAADLPLTVTVLGTDGSVPYTIRTNDPAWA